MKLLIVLGSGGHTKEMIRLVDLIEALKQRGRLEEAEFYELLVCFELNFLHGFSKEKIMKMTIEEINTWYNLPVKPSKYDGWNHWWGKAVIG